MFALSTASLESSLSLHSVSRLELPLPVSGLVQMGPLLLLQGLSCAGPALFVADSVQLGSSLFLRHFSQVGSSTSVCGMCLDLTLLASDFANLELFVFLRGPSWHDLFCLPLHQVAWASPCRCKMQFVSISCCCSVV